MKQWAIQITSQSQCKNTQLQVGVLLEKKKSTAKCTLRFKTKGTHSAEKLTGILLYITLMHNYVSTFSPL